MACSAAAEGGMCACHVPMQGSMHTGELEHRGRSCRCRQSHAMQPHTVIGQYHWEEIGSGRAVCLEGVGWARFPWEECL